MQSLQSNAIHEGDRVMVPLHGLCHVVSVADEIILGQRGRYATLRPEGESELLRIPYARLAEQGIRPVVSAEIMNDLLARPLEVSGADLLTLPPHQRLQRWVHQLREGDAGIRRTILYAMRYLERKGQKLSRDEANMRDRLRSGMRREVEVALGKSPAQATVLVTGSLRPQQRRR